ncbi:hypothetical protein [Hungatella hathewayi]|uniref:hypothetical protein n=1 Tax=Hungatella hathewayi TaxID=154046 RepID=UPI002A82A155|nr:hypothetical protein [Hungatella hathewayi]
MNEQTGTVTMYDTVEEIKNLNRVEGFDPRKFMRTLTGDDGTTKQYLDVVYRKLWFRLKNPDGKIVKKILKLTDQTAIVEARVYLRKDDAEESYIASALAQKYFERESQFGPKYVELAETAAVGRALADAGYGLQFADLEGEIDPNVVDAPLGIPMGGGSGQNGNPNGGMMAGDTGMQGTYQNQAPPQGQPVQNQYSNHSPAQNQQPVQNRQQATAPNQRASAGQATQGQNSGMQANASVPAGTSPMDGQFGMQETASMAYGMPPAFGGGMPAQAPPAANQNPATNQNPAAMQNQAGRQSAPNAPVFKPDMPIEQIYAQMTYPVAAAVVIPIGYNHGKTLGQVAVEKPKDLQWYVNEYKGPDNILRAAARYLIDKATNQAA